RPIYLAVGPAPGDGEDVQRAGRGAVELIPVRAVGVAEVEQTGEVLHGHVRHAVPPGHVRRGDLLRLGVAARVAVDEPYLGRAVGGLHVPGLLAEGGILGAEPEVGVRGGPAEGERVAGPEAVPVHLRQASVPALQGGGPYR